MVYYAVMKYLKDEFIDFFNGVNGGFLFSKSSDDPFRPDFPVDLTDAEKNLLSEDFKSFSHLLSFLDGTFDIFALCGFAGSNKTSYLKILEKTLDPSVLCFFITHFEGSDLDDMLLDIYKKFLVFQTEKKIVLPKTDTKVFSEKINVYLKSTGKKLLFVFDSAGVRKESDEIINFIKYVSSLKNSKVIVTGRDFTANPYGNGNFVDSVITKNLSLETCEEILKRENVDSSISPELFKKIRGHKICVKMTAIILKLLNMPLNGFYNDYLKSEKPFFDYMLEKIISLTPERFFKVLWFLCEIRVGVTENFLLGEKLASESELNYLVDRLLICRENGFVYMKDYVKQKISETLQPEDKKEINTYLERLYDSQLPKKPGERDLSISRSTMRKESAYHRQIAEKEIVRQNKPNSISYLSYSKIIGGNASKEQSKPAERKVKPAPRGFDFKRAFSGRVKLTDEERKILERLDLRASKAEDFSLKDVRDNPEPVPKKTPEPQEKEDFSTVLNDAETAFAEFKYEKSATLFNKALSLSDEDEHTAGLKPFLTEQIAVCKRKLQNNEEALRYFDVAAKLYLSDEKIEKVVEILSEKAQIYKETYNRSAEINEYKKILPFEGKMPEEQVVDVLFRLSEAEFDSGNKQEASECALKAIDVAVRSSNKILVAESCFKYGLCADDAGDLNTAFRYYARCIQENNDPKTNKYLAFAYSNIAAVYEEQNLISKAVKFYEEALKIDKLNENYEGMFFEYSKLSEFAAAASTEIALKYLFSALDCAKQIKDNMGAASTYMKIGDLYYDSNSVKESLEYYLLAKALLIKQPRERDVRRVNLRIDDMKRKIGPVMFDSMLKRIQGTDQ